MKLLLITDAWNPQVNGVVTTYKNVIEGLAKKGISTEVIHPGLFTTMPCPGYTEISLVLNFWKLKELIESANADYIHIAVEGPLGLAARYYLNKQKLHYTTAFHTRFPEYINKRLPFIPVKWGYAFMKWFHKRSSIILVTTKSMQQDLARYGMKRMVVWGRGVDTDLFQPKETLLSKNKEPVFINVGRIAVEKNIEAFLQLDLPGKKVIVGDGPSRKALEKKYPDVEFAGYKYGKELSACYAEADVFVFPSKTDTFGLVMLEAMACGVPAVGYPVPGPIDVIKQHVTGVISKDLRKACLDALELNRDDCRQHALNNNWSSCAETMRTNLVAAK